LGGTIVYVAGRMAVTKRVGTWASQRDKSMEELVQLERKVQSIYEEVLGPLAQRTAFELDMSGRDPVGQPSVLFLGNHSSGKSSFINYLIGTELQKTGLAPTDDGFTVITYGEKQDDFDGQTVVTHPDLSFKDLQELGPPFLSHLRLKTYPHELLKSVTLIDSPGMIDAAGSANTRGYDFPAAVRAFAERADLILFFFDPDKPGTTGETVSIFTGTLAELEHKLMIVLHKVDLFRNMRDFARTYGTLCWNLSKAIQTKDIPHIYNTYLPNLSRGGGEGVIPLQDFEASREEVIAEVKRAPTRRTDNLVSDLHQAARRLSMHARVGDELARRFRVLCWKWWGATGGVVVLGLLLAWSTWGSESWKWPLTGLLGGLGLGVGLWFASREVFKSFLRQVATPEGLGPYFEKAYRDELTLRDRADLHACWASVRGQTLATLRVLGVRNLPRAITSRRWLRRLDQVIASDIPGLRREIAAHHTALQKIGSDEPES
jgi:hypothetical protein